MGGWKNASGGLYTSTKCSCGKGIVRVYVSDHEESDYPPFERDDVYSVRVDCCDMCERNRDNLSKTEIFEYSMRNKI